MQVGKLPVNFGHGPRSIGKDRTQATWVDSNLLNSQCSKFKPGDRSPLCANIVPSQAVNTNQQPFYEMLEGHDQRRKYV